MSSSISLPTFRLPSKAKFWKKRRSEDLGESDPSYRAIYLGNVLTGWAKGDGCIDKPLATLWKNHIGTDKPNIVMKVTVCGSGLKAVTKEHGLTEYWANRITYSAADPAYPKVFCWIYRHEGRKLKQELRCHAVLCPSASKARFMAERLKERLHQALVDFKKEKVWRQNARLSLANSTYDNPTMPYRKVLNSVSGNYRPPIERGKAAPKLKIIEEVIIEEDESIHEDSNEDRESSAGVHTMINERSVDGPTEAQISGAARFSLDDGLTLASRLNRFNDDQLSCSTLINEDSDVNYKRLSVCSDNISMVTTETTVILEPEMSIDPHPTTKTPHSKNSTAPEGDLIDVSNDPRPRPKPAPRHSLAKSSNGSSSATNNTSINCEINIENGCDPGTGNCGSSDEEEDEDVVTNYLDKMSIVPSDNLGIDSLQVRAHSYSSRSPDSHQFSTKSDSSVVGENDEIEDEEETCEDEEKRNVDINDLARNGLVETKISSSKMNDQDTISDESGYSEESNAVSTINGPHSSSTSPEVGVKVIDRNIVGKNMNGANNNTPSNILSSKTSIMISQEKDDRASYDVKNTENNIHEDILNTSNESSGSVQEDPTVHGVLISDFSASERLKYLERSRQSSIDRETKLSTSAAPPPDFFQNKIQEFVINI